MDHEDDEGLEGDEDQAMIFFAEVRTGTVISEVW
jgi:hypothetical protein